MRRNIPMLKDVDPEASARLQKIRQGVCPTCGGQIVRNLIEQGRHKGHGVIYCSKCGREHIRI